MKHLLYILIIAFGLTILIFSCASYDDIQIEHVMVKLVKKELHARGGRYAVFQYWEDTRRKGVIYFEELPIGDTGYYIGMLQPAFVKR